MKKHSYEYYNTYYVHSATSLLKVFSSKFFMKLVAACSAISSNVRMLMFKLSVFNSCIFKLPSVILWYSYIINFINNSFQYIIGLIAIIIGMLYYMMIAFCDDDQHIVDVLAPRIENLIDKNNIYRFHFEYFCFTDATQLLKQHLINPFDIVFLDIEMPNANGLHIADKLYEVNNSIFIFYVTSYRTYILPSIKHRVYRYILKDDLTTLESDIKSLLQDLSMFHCRFRFKFKKDYYSIPYNSILYFESNLSKVKIHTIGKTYQTTVSMKKLINELPPIFCRCHSAFIVNLSHVESVGTHSLILYNNQEIPISKQHKQEVLYLFLHFSY